MKWIEKGSEYDVVYSTICDLLSCDRSIIIYGAGKRGRLFAEDNKYSYKLNTTFFVDKNAESMGYKWRSYEIIHPNELDTRRSNEPIIVVASYYGQLEIRNELLRSGYREWHDFYILDSLRCLCDLYEKNYIRIPLLEFPITGKCTLKCKNCGFFAPYYRSSKEYDTNAVLDDIHLAFDRFDYIDTIRFVGGEPSLHSHLAEICTSIFEDYSGRFDRIFLITNGTIPLSEKMQSLIEVRKKSFFISVSDYSQTAGHNYGERVKLLLSQLKKQNISFHLESQRNWYDYGFPRSKEASTDLVAARIFESCLDMDCRTVWNNKLWYCSSACSACRGGLLKPNEGNDFINLNKTLDKKVLFEFLSGYSVDGFNELCRYCCVPQKINIEAGVQML